MIGGTERSGLTSCVSAWCGLALALALGCAGNPEPAKPDPYVAPAEYWKFDFDGRVWNPGSKVRDKLTATETFVPPGQTDKDWSEIVTTALTFGAQRATTVSAIAEKTKKMLEKDCPTFKWEYLERSERSVTYEWSRSICKKVQPQHELTRLSVGRLGIHRLSYAAKSPQMAAGLRRQWLKALGEATLQLRDTAPAPAASSTPATPPQPAAR